MSAPPRVLYLTYVPPAPAISGDRVRFFNLIEQLGSNGWDVTVGALAPPQSMPAVAEIAGAGSVRLLRTVPSSVQRAAGFAVSSALRRSYEPGWFWSRAGQRAVEQVFAEARPDVVIAGQLFMTGFVSADGWHVPIVLDAHNCESLRLRVASRRGSLRNRLVSRIQLGPTRRYEQEITRRVSLTAAVSEVDAAAFRRMGARRVVVVPNGTTLEPYEERPRSGIVFVGSLGYGANRDALRHLLRDVLPRVSRPTTLRIVGSGANRERMPTRVGLVEIVHVGQVPDVTPFLEESLALVAPLRFGGGTKLKVLEAMARGAVVVTTPVGAQGLAVTSGTHLLVGRSAAAMAAAIDRVMADDADRLRLRANALAYVRANHSWKQIGRVLDGALRELVGIPPIGEPASADAASPDAAGADAAGADAASEQAALAQAALPQAAPLRPGDAGGATLDVAAAVRGRHDGAEGPGGGPGPASDHASDHAPR